MLGAGHTLVARGPARPRLSRPVLRRLSGVRATICSAATDGQPKDAAWAAAITRHYRPTTIRPGAPHGRPAHAGRRRAVAAARGAWRAAGLDGSGAGRDARARSACRAAATFMRSARSAMTAGAANAVPLPDLAAGPQRRARFHPGRPHRRHVAATPAGPFDYNGQRLHLSRYPPGLLGRRQSVPPSPGPQPAAPGLRAVGHAGGARDSPGPRRRATPTSCCPAR